ncbi:hypothetical protein MKX01_010271, partial [Papaver californicum]
MFERMRKKQPVSILEKLRSNILRRKRFQISPVLSGSSSNSLYGKVFKQPDDDLSTEFPPVVQDLVSSNLTREKKQVVISETKEIHGTAAEKVMSKLVSESYFCGKVDENEGGSTVSEAISFSETSCIQPAPFQRKSMKNFNSEEYSCNDSAKKANISVEIQGDNVSEISFVKSSSELENQNQIARVKDDEIRAPETSTFSEVSGDYYNVEMEFANSDSTAKQKPNDIESDCKFTCTEDYPFLRNSDVEVEFSDYTDESSLFDSESQTDFSEPGKSSPTAYFSLKQSSKLSSSVSHYKFLILGDENNEDSYKHVGKGKGRRAIKGSLSRYRKHLAVKTSLLKKLNSNNYETKAERKMWVKLMKDPKHKESKFLKCWAYTLLSRMVRDMSLGYGFFENIWFKTFCIGEVLIKHALLVAMTEPEYLDTQRTMI